MHAVRLHVSGMTQYCDQIHKLRASWYQEGTSLALGVLGMKRKIERPAGLGVRVASGPTFLQAKAQP